MANAYDSRQFSILGQRVDLSVWWHGGSPGEYQDINGRNVHLWDYGNIWSHNVIEYPLELGQTAFSLWDWFIQNVSTIEDWDWTTSVDAPYDVMWAFRPDGTMETNAPGGSGFHHSATFFIKLVKYAGSRNYYLVCYAATSEVALQDFDSVVSQKCYLFVRCQQEYLLYQGFSPLAGLTNNDIYAGYCTLCTPNQVYKPDFVGAYPSTQLDNTYFCLIQNGTIFQQCLRDGDTVMYNDFTGHMEIEGVGYIYDNLPNGIRSAVPSIRMDGLTPVTGYFPDLGVEQIGTIGEDFYCTIYEMALYLNGTSIGAKMAIPWSNFQSIPMEEYTIETPDDDFEPVDEEGGDSQDFIQDDDEQKPNPLPNEDTPTPTPSPGPNPVGTKGGALTSQMARLYSPNETQMAYLSRDVLWSDNFLTQMKKLFTTDPVDAIIMLGFVPINLATWKGQEENLIIGTYDTGIPFTPLKKDYISIEAGTIEVSEKFAAALDYEPYSTCEVYLPFIGFVKVSMSDILHPSSSKYGGGDTKTKGSIFLKYKVNLFTGDCVAQLFAKGVPQSNGRVNQHLVGQYTGNCMEIIPITGVNYANYYKNLTNTAVGLGLGAMLSAGNPLVAGGMLATSAMNAINQPPQMQRSGGAAGGAARLQYLQPFIRLTRPAQSMALSEPDGNFNQKGYKNLEGVACNFYVEKLDELLGYTQVESIELKGFNATDTELSEIDTLLKNGVFIGTGH